MLFDEKIGSTINLALVIGFQETGSENICRIHKDILKEVTSKGSKIIADGQAIYDEENWKI